MININEIGDIQEQAISARIKKEAEDGNWAHKQRMLKLAESKRAAEKRLPAELTGIEELIRGQVKTGKRALVYRTTTNNIDEGMFLQILLVETLYASGFACMLHDEWRITISW